MHEIRLAHETDAEAIVQFIDQHWKKNHILVTCQELLDWQHLDRARGRYNFVVGIERQTQAMHGLLGFIPLTQFDPEIELSRLCWMAIWKAADVARGHKLGRRLLAYLEDTIQPRIVAGISASAMSLPMYRERGYHTARLNHHYILNPEMTSFRLVTMKASWIPRVPSGTRNADKRIDRASESDIVTDTVECFLTQQELPRKTPAYLINRYLRHPIYAYQAYCIRDGMKTTGIIVTRVCSHGESRALRIVDFVGPSNALRGLRSEWNSLLMNIGAEYLDFYNAGINEDDLLASGFTRRGEGDGIVVPNYFEPFSKDNVEIDYGINAPQGQPYRIVKGDSDQDRPNLVSRIET